MSCLDQRFLSYNKLIKPSEFKAVFGSAKRTIDGNFIILFRHNGLDVARIGMAISKKNVHLSTVRNKIKRLIRESFRRQKNNLKGFDIVVITKKTIEIKNNNIISNSLSNHWDKLLSA